jgi:ATP-dependent Clp protease adaptor protein ClpS
MLSMLTNSYQTVLARQASSSLDFAMNSVTPICMPRALSMTKNATDLLEKTRPKIERPRLYKVILLNDDFTPRAFVVLILKAEFSMNEAQAQQVMITAHQRGVCVVAVFVQDIAETKATRATDAARKKGYPLLFTTEPEE